MHSRIGGTSQCLNHPNPPGTQDTSDKQQAIIPGLWSCESPPSGLVSVESPGIFRKAIQMAVGPGSTHHLSSLIPAYLQHLESSLNPDACCCLSDILDSKNSADRRLAQLWLFHLGHEAWSQPSHGHFLQNVRKVLCKFRYCKLRRHRCHGPSPQIRFHQREPGLDPP